MERPGSRQLPRAVADDGDVEEEGTFGAAPSRPSSRQLPRAVADDGDVEEEVSPIAGDMDLTAPSVTPDETNVCYVLPTIRSTGSGPKPVLLGRTTSFRPKTLRWKTPGIALPGTGDGGPASPRPFQFGAVLAVLCMSGLVGLLTGFFSSSMEFPICRAVFGPIGEDGRSSEQQCEVATHLYQIPWLFRLVYAVFLDRIGFLRTRRRGWIVFGWTVAATLTAVLAFFADGMAVQGRFPAYTMAVMTICAFYLIADVAGGGLLIDMTRLEPDTSRGALILAAQGVRSLAAFASSLLGILAMNGESYYTQAHPDAEVIFSFQLSFGQVHGVLATCALLLYLPMVLWLRDADCEDSRRPPRCKTALRSFWRALQTKALCLLMLLTLLYVAVASMPNPATDIVTGIVSPSHLQQSVCRAGGTVVSILGICLCRAALNRNWRVAYTGALLLKFLVCGVAVLVVQNAWEVGQCSWFYPAINALPHAVHGYVHVLLWLVLAEVAPAGSEATACELLTTLQHSAAILGVGLETGLGRILALEEALEGAGTPDELSGPVAGATFMTLGVHLLGAGLTVAIMPRSRQMCREWLGDTWWHRHWVGLLALGIVVVSIAASSAIFIVGVVPQVSCLEVAGGSGC